MCFVHASPLSCVHACVLCMHACVLCWSRTGAALACMHVVCACVHALCACMCFVQSIVYPPLGERPMMFCADPRARILTTYDVYIQFAQDAHTHTHTHMRVRMHTHTHACATCMCACLLPCFGTCSCFIPTSASMTSWLRSGPGGKPALDNDGVQLSCWCRSSARASKELWLWARSLIDLDCDSHPARARASGCGLDRWLEKLSPANKEFRARPWARRAETW